jgi:hypothetical protein
MERGGWQIVESLQWIAKLTFELNRSTVNLNYKLKT